MLTWPETVPHMPRYWRVKQSSQGGIESEMQSGLTRVRRQFTVDVGIVDLGIVMGLPEFATFKAFVKDDLKSGTTWFEMPLWDGTGCPTRSVRIRDGGRYIYDRIGSAIEVRFSLDVKGGL